MSFESVALQSDPSAREYGVGLAPARLDPARLDLVFSRQPLETLVPNETLFWEGDAASHVFLITEGLLRAVRHLSGGRRVITGFVHPGDALDLSMPDQNACTVEAVTRVRLRRRARRRVDEDLALDPDARQEWQAALRREMEATRQLVALLARKTAEERVCSFLLLMARHPRREQDATPLIALPMPRLDIADYLGLTKETVSRVMARLTQRGVIGRMGRHSVALRRLDMLIDFAGDGGAIPARDHRPASRADHPSRRHPGAPV